MDAIELLILCHRNNDGITICVYIHFRNREQLRRYLVWTPGKILNYEFKKYFLWYTTYQPSTYELTRDSS